ncbi:MAG: class I SAM-dependent methyltransferase, partial [Alphaproteobacteria bacterium]|nr:class I SAM-dependent methyltransferase [Alphaproteobacteria bacterium]
LALERVPNGARVLDLGRSPGHFIEALKGKGCTVTGVGPEKHDGLGAYDRFLHRDIGTGLPDLDFADFDFVLALDVIEHMEAPEAFMDQLRSAAGRAPDTVFLFSAGNVAFAVTRLMLLIGQFNYGKRGILDLTHRRLFTRNALVRLLKEGGFVIAREAGLPPPFALALGENQFSRTAERLAARLASLWARMFAFQFLIEAKAQPTLDWLIDHALSSSAARVEALDRGRTDSAP